MTIRIQCAIAAFIITASTLNARDVNYDEDKVGSYNLPPLLVCNGGTTVSSADEWTTMRRPEILELFQQHVYGDTPATPGDFEFQVINTRNDALGGIATRKTINISLGSAPHWPGIDMLLYIPNHVEAPAPVFLGLNFFGNHTVTTETDILLSTRWLRPSDQYGIINNRATEASRGVLTRRWPLEMILNRGYAVATAYCGDIEPDHPDGWKEGIRAVLSKDGAGTNREHEDWGAIGAWAWGLSRMLDYCETDSAINSDHAIVIGHSRLGKAALWAGAQDRRFAITVSNNSGEGGAALARRNYGETIEIITNAFPHWFCRRYASYSDRVSELPVDQHMLISLMAPRPAYIASASEDRWADPYGEFLSGVHAGPVYKLFRKTGLGTETWPPANKPIGHHIGYHLRSGNHDISRYDWEQYLDFADRHFAE